MSTMTTLSQLYPEVAKLEARASAAEARATAAEEELKRYQRADVGERVREYAHDHEQDTRDIPRLGIGATAERMHRQRGELLDIARQQQAEIERLKERLRAYDEADTIPVLRSSDCLHCYREHETCPYHSKYADRITPRMPETKPQPKVEPELLEKFESLQEAPKEEAYRPGLPPEALRKVWRTWDIACRNDDPWMMEFDGERYRCNHGAWIYIASAEWDEENMRPHGATWSEVEQKAARLLGEQDAKAGRDRKDTQALWESLGCPSPGCDIGNRYTDAYHAGYDGAIEFRVGANIDEKKAPKGVRWQGKDGRLWDKPGCVIYRPVINGRPIPWSRAGG